MPSAELGWKFGTNVGSIGYKMYVFIVNMFYFSIFFLSFFPFSLFILRKYICVCAHVVFRSYSCSVLARIVRTTKLYAIIHSIRLMCDVHAATVIIVYLHNAHNMGPIIVYENERCDISRTQNLF